MNATAHHANSSDNALEHPSAPINGLNATQSVISDTQSTNDIKIQAPNLDPPASTQPSAFPLKDPVSSPILNSTEVVMETLPLVATSPIIQQPLSDARHMIPPEFNDKPSASVLGDSFERPSATEESNIPEKSLPSPAPEPVEPVDGSRDHTADPKQDSQPPIDIAMSQSSLPLVEPSTALPFQVEDAPIASYEGVTNERQQDDTEAALSVPATRLDPLAENFIDDQVMNDAEQPAKQSRAREGDDDLDDEPAAKRSRTDNLGQEEEEAFKIPDRPQIDTSVATDTQSATLEPSPMTKPRKKHLQKAIANIKRNQAAKLFLVPVDAEALNIPTYYNVVTQPMDLKTIEDKLRADGYPTTDALRSDFDQIVQNTKLFNGEIHPVTQSAFAIRDKFEHAMTNLPSLDVPDSAPSKKKAPDPMVVRAPPPRRESRSSLPGSARSPASAVSPQTFALGPEGLPLIRRDSTIDGRPKREIHRPAPKDLPYTNQKPKKKKYILELKFCDHVLKELAKVRHKDIYDPFKVPVDPVALNIPSYHSVVKKPMDFGTIRTRLDRGSYENAKEFEVDARQVFKNCYLFNPENDPVNRLGKGLEAVFNDEWSNKRQWLEDNAPESGQRSPASSDDEESDEEEEEEEEEDDNQLEIVSKLQKQIAEMSKQVEMITSGAKKKTPPTASKKSTKPAKPVKKETKKAAPAPVKAEKKAASKASKKSSAPYVTYEQKQDISTRINSLTEAKMSQALSIIRSNMPNLKGVQEDELELDIDELSNEVLYKLLQFVRKHAPRADDSPLQAPVNTSASAPTRKKNKPMSKHEQEARIAQVQNNLSTFQKGAGGVSRKMTPSLIEAS